MKMKFAIYGIMAVFVMSACSKSVDDDLGETTNFMKVTVDGREEIYNAVSARWIEGGSSLEIKGTKDGSSWVAFSLLSDSERIPAGSYELDDNSSYTIMALHNRMENNAQINFAATRNTLSTLDKFAVQLENISERTVEGKFSGTLIYVEGSNVLGSVELKNGSFSSAIAGK